MYSVIFAGTPKCACTPLQSLLDDDRFDVKAVISQPDKPIGRKQVITSPEVKVLAEQNWIKVYQPEKISKILDVFEEIKPDFFIVVAYGKIIPNNILDIPKYNINIHGSILPKYRWASPVQESIKNWDQETGISIMNIDEKMDTGAVYKVHKINILNEDTVNTVFDKLSVQSEKIGDDLDEIFNGLNSIPQNNELATYCKKIIKQDWEIKFLEETAISIYDKMRAFSAWPWV